MKTEDHQAELGLAGTGVSKRSNEEDSVVHIAMQSDALIRVYFDGGYDWNTGDGYGSYRILMPGKRLGNQVRIEFPGAESHNVCEYRTALHALYEVRKKTTKKNRKHTKVLFYGDSQLVVNGLARRWKINAPHFWPIAMEFFNLCIDFGEVDLIWHPREESVKILGH